MSCPCRRGPCRGFAGSICVVLRSLVAIALGDIAVKKIDRSCVRAHVKVGIPSTDASTVWAILTSELLGLVGHRGRIDTVRDWVIFMVGTLLLIALLRFTDH